MILHILITASLFFLFAVLNRDILASFFLLFLLSNPLFINNYSFKIFKILKLFKRDNLYRQFKSSIKYQQYDFKSRSIYIKNIIKNMNYNELIENKEIIVKRSKILSNLERKSVLETIESSLDYHEGLAKVSKKPSPNSGGDELRFIL